MTPNSRKSGEALIVALIIIGLLTMMAVGINYLIVRSLKFSQQYEFGNMAYYAAEGGAELALAKVKPAHPGVELPVTTFSVGAADEKYTTAYQVAGLGERIPLSADGPYLSLGRNKSVTYTMSRPTGEPVKNFRITYRVSGEQDVGWTSGKCLKWELAGFGKTGEKPTESMGGYLECSALTQEVAAVTMTGQYKAMTTPLIFEENKAVSDFLDQHDEVYLKLTNIVDSNDFPQLQVYYSLSTEAYDLLPTQYTDITAEGNFGDYYQTLSIRVPQQQTPELFNFSLFRPQ